LSELAHDATKEGAAQDPGIDTGRDAVSVQGLHVERPSAETSARRRQGAAAKAGHGFAQPEESKESAG